MTNMKSAAMPGRSPRRSWFEQSVARAARGVPREKLVVAIGSYAYDWHDGSGEPLAIEEAWQAARESGAKPVWDKASGNSSFAYEEGQEPPHGLDARCGVGL